MTRNTRNNSNDRFPGAFAPEDDDDLPKSKSQRKRDMTALQDLGVELEALAKDRLARVPMPEALSDAILAARKITSHEGKRRQMQFVGKVMRGLDDDEVAAIRAALDGFKGTSKAETAKMHLIERWRELLLADDANLTKFLGEHPGLDVQSVRNIIRNARKEKEMSKPPKYYRELFQAIKAALDAGQPDEPADKPETPEEPEA
ncbi:ribosome biogenesis factor YjgA [Cupriavidus pauculus]|uniref:ribosome biogenesis factor YjgA n=1 Tax=Cupriavidus pauculus TaxID=82633 RepID=UPI002088A9C2|nr:ribosome biogenesis factor YjgA [Cupriavidus pauculus]GJG96496.1 ribosome-associated protein [Cupriavidus pauculus]